jgi:hypothetical protein
MFSNTSPQSDAIEALKAQLASIAPPARRTLKPIPTRHPSLDRCIQGWAVPGLTEISGPLGSGRIQLCLPSIAHISQQSRIGIVDPLSQIYPPGWESLQLNHLLVVRPSPERVLWAAEQLARSGCFPLIGFLSTTPLGRRAMRLLRAAEHGNCAVLIWNTQSDLRIPSKLRIQMLGRQNNRLKIRLPLQHQEMWV